MASRAAAVKLAFPRRRRDPGNATGPRLSDHLPPETTLEPLLAAALEAAEAAAAVQRRYAGRLGMDAATEKGTADYVSEADVEAQRAALAVLGERFPDHAVLAEEDDGPRRSSGPGPLWVVDPIDGTTNFLHHHPMHAVSVAVLVDGRAEAGVVACPSTGERWWASRGRGAWKNGRRVRVSGQRQLRTSLVGTGFPFKALDRLEGYLTQLGRVLRSTSGARRGGAAALDLAYLAEGALDAFWELDLKPWDWAAGALLIEEAGGTVERVEGGPLGLEPGSVLAANSPALLGALRNLLAGGAPER